MVSATAGPNQSDALQDSDESTYYQIGKVDSEFLAWKFHVFNQHGEIISTVDRAFRGIGREVRAILSITNNNVSIDHH